MPARKYAVLISYQHFLLMKFELLPFSQAFLGISVNKK